MNFAPHHMFYFVFTDNYTRKFKAYHSDRYNSRKFCQKGCLIKAACSGLCLSITKAISGFLVLKNE